MNMRHWKVAIILASALVCGAQATLAQPPNEEPIYGSQMMTPEERADYHAKMRAARTAEEQERIRNKHHAEMQARAKERGMTLPDEPPQRGMGPRGRMAPGDGMGPGGGSMGPGGMGPGGRTTP